MGKYGYGAVAGIVGIVTNTVLDILDNLCIRGIRAYIKLNYSG